MFFQNPFDSEYRGHWVMSDRQYVLTFSVPPNKNKSDYQLAWTAGPYDFSSVTDLTINYAFDENLKQFVSRAIDVSGATPAETTALEVVDALNADEFFSDHFLAKVKQVNFDGVEGETVLIVAKPGRRKQIVKLYISNSGAETKLKFNKKSGVAELPSYFARHTIENRFNEDSDGQLVELDETDLVDQGVITDAGLNYADMQADWELLGGRASGLFMFRKQTVDGSSRVTEIIEYPAGAAVGDFARKIQMTYTGAKTEPDQITEIPHVLVSGDLVTPP